MKNPTYLPSHFNERFLIVVFSFAVFCCLGFSAETSNAAVPKVKLQKKGGGGSMKGGGGSMRGGGSMKGGGSMRGGSSHSGGGFQRPSGGGVTHHKSNGYSKSGASYSSRPSYSHNSHSNYRGGYSNDHRYNSNYRSHNTNYRSYNSNYRSYPSRGYLSVSPYGLSFGYGGIGVSRYYRPTYSYGNYGSYPYGSGYSNYDSAYGTYSPYGTYSAYESYQPNLNYSYPYSSEVLTPAEMSATGQLFDESSYSQPTLAGPLEVVGDAVLHIPTNEAASGFTFQSEQDFKHGNYSSASQLAQQALAADPDNGYLMLFASQTSFALGEFENAADYVNKATSILASEDWGYFVKSFKTVYGHNDYVSQTDQLSQHIEERPDDAQALALRGYHYGALGYVDAATKDFRQALASDPKNELANHLLPVMGSVSQPVSPEPIQAPTPEEEPIDVPDK